MDNIMTAKYVLNKWHITITCTVQNVAVEWNGVATVVVVDRPNNRNFFINNYCWYILFGFN